MSNALYLNGTTQYLSSPADGGMAMGGNVFTMEGFFKKDTGSNGAIRPLMNNGDGTTGGFKIEITAGNVLKAYVFAGSTAITLTGTTTVTENAYHHFALNKASGDVYKLYLDGVQEATATQGGNVTGASTNYIGYDGTNFFKGYLCDLRVHKGISIYDAAFTPSTSLLGQGISVTGTAGTSIIAEPTSDGVLHDQFGVAGVSSIAEPTSDGNLSAVFFLTDGVTSLLEPTSTGTLYITLMATGASTLTEPDTFGSGLLTNVGAGAYELTTLLSAGAGGWQYSSCELANLSSAGTGYAAMLAYGEQMFGELTMSAVVVLPQIYTGACSFYEPYSAGSGYMGTNAYGSGTIAELVVDGTAHLAVAANGASFLLEPSSEGSVAIGLTAAAGRSRLNTLEVYSRGIAA